MSKVIAIAWWDNPIRIDLMGLYKAYGSLAEDDLYLIPDAVADRMEVVHSDYPVGDDWLDEFEGAHHLIVLIEGEQVPLIRYPMTGHDIKISPVWRFADLKRGE